MSLFEFVFLGKVRLPQDPRVKALFLENRVLGQMYDKANTERQEALRALARAQPEGRLPMSSEIDSEPTLPSSKAHLTKRQPWFVLAVTWVMALALVLSLLGVIALVVVGDAPPPVYTEVLSFSILFSGGYLSGISMAYFGIQD